MTMTTTPRYPSLFQINSRVWLERLSREAGRRITLADIDDTTIDRFAEQGFDWVWRPRSSCRLRLAVVGSATTRRRERQSASAHPTATLSLMPGPARTTVAISSSSITPATRGNADCPLSFPEVRGKQVRLTDVIGTEVYDREGSELVDHGLYIDHAPWHFNMFELGVL
jgi:hypothetical protein